MQNLAGVGAMEEKPNNSTVDEEKPELSQVQMAELMLRLAEIRREVESQDEEGKPSKTIKWLLVIAAGLLLVTLIMGNKSCSIF